MSFLEDAKRYASSQGFAVFPAHGIFNGKCTCGSESCSTPDHRGKRSAGKHPWTINGLKNASTDPSTLEVLWHLKEHANIAIATGPASNIFVLDIDGPQGESSLAEYPPLPATLTSYTGNGRHMVFRYPARKVVTRASKFAPGLDIRGAGGYIIAPPSIHANGNSYQWLDPSAPILEAPEWLLDIVCRAAAPLPPKPFEGSPATPSSRFSIDEVREMLSFLDPDCPYDEWIQVGMALHNDNYPLTIWDEWSRRGSKYTLNCTAPHWRSFRSQGGTSLGSLVHMASLSGWKPKEIRESLTLDMDNHPAREFLIQVGAYTPPKSSAPSKAPSSPHYIDPLKLPGIIGDTVRAIVSTAQKPQPELALLNTLAALGAVFGRRYASPMDTRTNLYAVGMAVTASGKDHSRRFIKRLMAESQLDSFLGSDTFVSGSGLLSAVSLRPAQIMHLDEFGMLLEAITDQRGAHYMKAASKVITELYSTSSGTFVGGQYADRKQEPIHIAAPNLCIYGTTTPDKYTSALNKSVIQSGELNRFLVLRPKIDRPERRRYLGSARPPEDLIAAWAAFKSPSLNNALILPEIIPVPWPELEDRIWEMGLYEDRQIASSLYGALWGRYRENTIKVAMIFAIARNPQVPIIISDDLTIAEAITSQAVHYALTLAEEHMADSQHEKDCQEILRILKDNKNKMTKTDLSRATKRMDMKTRDSALKSLMDCGDISIEKETIGNFRPTFWVIRG